jgi:hypothetical protein
LPRRRLHALAVAYLAIARQEPDYAGQFLAELPTGELPFLTEHIQVHMAPERPGGVDEFEFGLDLTLDGLEGMRVAGLT